MFSQCLNAFAGLVITSEDEPEGDLRRSLRVPLRSVATSTYLEIQMDSDG